MFVHEISADKANAMTLTLGGSNIEALAAKCLDREKLGAFNLLAARNELSQMLEHIGKTAEFSTYTRHDITHIDALLSTADWVIPAATFAKLTIADALVICLSIYFHDLGMLVTKSEFLAREESNFPDFKTEILTDGSAKGVDFRERLRALEPDDHEHFLYEEFVRSHHADRVALWIKSTPSNAFGVSSEARALVQQILATLPEVVRHDVATVAHSHHLADLHDQTKYKVKRAYGPQTADMVNVQYAAFVLRTVDLFHMSQDRTPKIQSQLASPTDPLGQREWRKQEAVSAVIPESVPPGEQAKTIEVHAHFEDASGFFSLMEFLDYCESELRQTREWSRDAANSNSWAAKYTFPWDEIDRSSIETEGFHPKQFTFSFDEDKVLELLTGHTLYNDASVAIREILQNSIDAVRLDFATHSRERSAEAISVRYDSTTRTLTVLDRGTGMTQRTVEDHFLRVGSSGYQTKEFRESNPDFTSISRFGIGVLSAFMIADEVRVATISDGELSGREVVLKSVHGHYLIKDFDSTSDFAKRIGAHGTEIELKLRASSGLDHDILKLLKKWIVVPGCIVNAYIDSKEPISIGAADAATALEQRLLDDFSFKGTTRVVSRREDGVDIAIAQLWNAYYEEWDFLRARQGDLGYSRTQRTRIGNSSTSIQGIQVSNSVPGFTANGPLMIINHSGSGAPTTNVARTDLEPGQATDSLTMLVFRAVLQAVTDQIPEISAKVSQRFALREAGQMFSDAMELDDQSNVTRKALLREELRKLQVFPTEIESAVSARSSLDLQKTGFLSLLGPAADDAGRFLAWAPNDIGLLPLLRNGGLLEAIPHDQDMPLLGDFSAVFAWEELLWGDFEPTEFLSLKSGSSILLTFQPRQGLWVSERPYLSMTSTVRTELDVFGDAHNEFGFGRPDRNLFNEFATSETLVVSGFESIEMLFIGDYRMFLPNSEFSKTFLRIRARIDGGLDDDAVEEMGTLLAICDGISTGRTSIDRQTKYNDSMDFWFKDPRTDTFVEKESLLKLADQVFSLNTWSAADAWRQRRG